MIARIAGEFHDVADAAAAHALAVSLGATLDALGEDGALVTVALADVIEARRSLPAGAQNASHNAVISQMYDNALSEGL